MKYLFTLLFASCLTAAFSQEIPYPIDTNSKLITYEGIVDLAGYDKAALYQKGMEWVRSHYKDPGSFFTLREAEKGKIEGKHRIALFKTLDGKQVRSGQMVKYTITLWFKDNKYRYRITKFNLQRTSYFPAENWLEESLYKQKEVRNYLDQVDTFSKELVEELKTFMVTIKTEVDEDDW